jgi:hypothetical protein
MKVITFLLATLFVNTRNKQQNVSFKWWSCLYAHKATLGKHLNINTGIANGQIHTEAALTLGEEPLSGSIYM